jgi:hypothetical protein
MTCQLVTTFLEKAEQGSHRWLEIWVFRDGTLNLVVASDSGDDSEEHVFACAPYQLRKVLAGGRYQSANEFGTLEMRLEDDTVIARFDRHDGSEGWSLSAPVEDVDDGLLEAARMAGSYVA